MRRLVALAILAVASMISFAHGPTITNGPEPILQFSPAPPLDVTPIPSEGFAAIEPIGDPEIDRGCTSQERAHCNSFCRDGRVSACNVTGGVRYCYACIPIELLVENVREVEKEAL